MARPRKQGMDYFSHDTDAANDEKIESMRALFGNDGYAFYFILCERIYRTENAELDVSKPIILASIVKKLLVTEEKFHEMLEAAFELELFDREEYEKRRVITSRGIKRRFGEVQAMRERWRKRKEKQKHPSSSSVVFPVENTVEYDEEYDVENIPENNADKDADNDGENGGVTGESKVKERKEKKIKENINIYKSNNSNNTNPFLLFETEGFGTLSPIISDQIGEMIDRYGERWVVEAMKRAVYQGKRKLSYVNGILKSWQTSGVDEPWKQDRKRITKKPDIPIIQPNEPSEPISEEEKQEIQELLRELESLEAVGE